MATHLADTAAWMSGLRRAESDSRRDARRSSRTTAAGLVKINPLANWSDDAGRRVHRRARRAGQPAAVRRLPVDRVLAVHASCRSRRRRSRRPLGRLVQDRMWVAHYDSDRGLCRPRSLRAAALDHLDALESQAIFIIREVAAELRNPVVLFSGGKDSVVVLHLVAKAFAPAPFPFAVMHVDTGHNFPEVLDFRDLVVSKLGARLVVASVQAVDRRRPRAPIPAPAPPATGCSRRRCSTPSPSTGSTPASAALVATRTRPAAKERIFSFRDEFGQWDPRNQRPELWHLYNGRCGPGEHVRASRSPTGPSSTCGATSSRGPRAAVDLLRARA